MASGFVGLALKAAAVAVVLSLLFMPSLGRCPSLGPAPPPLLPPAPSALPVLCSDCLSPCTSNCSVSVPATCREYCDSSAPYCQTCLDGDDYACRELCKRDCAGSCPPAVCTECFSNCTSACIVSVPPKCTKSCAPNSTVPWIPCQSCLDGYGKQCRDSCEIDCVGAVGLATCLALLSPTPAPAPAPAPPVLCRDCDSHCRSTCDISVPPKCNQYCDNTHCAECQSDFIHEHCEAECCSNVDGTCSSCVCDNSARTACKGACTSLSCQPCLEGFGETCRDDCKTDCDATCIKEGK
ncbi:unnamed protein product [Alopecurus aequalis]